MYKPGRRKVKKLAESYRTIKQQAEIRALPVWLQSPCLAQHVLLSQGREERNGYEQKEVYIVAEVVRRGVTRDEAAGICSTLVPKASKST